MSGKAIVLSDLSDWPLTEDEVVCEGILEWMGGRGDWSGSGLSRSSYFLLPSSQPEKRVQDCGNLCQHLM